MTRRVLLAALVALSLAVTVPTRTAAQASGVALASLADADAWNGFFGPYRPTATGVDLRYVVLCYDTVTRVKAPRDVEVAIPDGSSLGDIRTLSTTAIVAGCAQYGITVPRGAVILPAVQLGL